MPWGAAICVRSGLCFCGMVGTNKYPVGPGLQLGHRVKDAVRVEDAVSSGLHVTTAPGPKAFKRGP